jgi:uncharacterized Zn finger protein
MSESKINLKCSHCGSELFEIPSTRRPYDIIKCAGCGAQGRYGDVQASAVSQAKKVIQDQLATAFKKAGFRVR